MHCNSVSFQSKRSMDFIKMCHSSYILLFLSFAVFTAAQFEIDHENDTFLMNGKPFRYVSGSIHYYRIPRQYWRDRFQRMKAAGLNAVSTYVEWSLHEPELDQYDFSGDKNIVEFIKTAQEEGLYVILRVGPYIDSERSMGGFPYWLIRENPDVVLRTSDPKFTDYVGKWLNYFLPIVKPLLFGNGGPIITVQVENEYGFYSTCDQDYKTWLGDLFKSHVGDKAVLFTVDGTDYPNLSCGKFSGVHASVDFHPGANVTVMKSNLRAVEPTGPFINSEFYAGWVTHWGENWATKDTNQIIQTLKDILDQDGNINFLMFAGSTNFGFSAGANGGPYKSVVTSYNFDSPITETGDLTPKYFAIREVLLNFFNLNTTVPVELPKGDYGVLNLQSSGKLLSLPFLHHLASQFTSQYPQTFEALSQDGGHVLYQVKASATGQNLSLNADARDYSHIYVNGTLVGTLSREQEQTSLQVSVTENDEISILVESLGRIDNWSDNKDSKGLLSNVTLDGKVLEGFTETVFDFTQISEAVNHCVSNEMHCNDGFGFAVYTGSFLANVSSTLQYEGETFPADTFLDVALLTKGLVFVNGYNLGRYWSTRGPVYSLYIPGVWLKFPPEVNEVVLIDENLDSPQLSVPFVDSPIYGDPKQ